jgi:hypothetical protein
MEQLVAAEATREWPQVERAESAKHFDQLALSVRFANEVATCHSATHQQANVSRQKSPALTSCQIRQRRIVCFGIIGRIKPGKAQSTRQFTEMHVGEEADGLEWLGSNAGVRSDIEGHEPREDRDAVAAPNDLIEADGQTVDEDQVDLRVGNSRSLNDILHRWMTVHDASPWRLSAMRRQEIVEGAVHAKGYLAHIAVPYAPSSRSSWRCLQGSATGVSAGVRVFIEAAEEDNNRSNPSTLRAAPGSAHAPTAADRVPEIWQRVPNKRQTGTVVFTGMLIALGRVVA